MQKQHSQSQCKNSFCPGIISRRIYRPAFKVFLIVATLLTVQSHAMVNCCSVISLCWRFVVRTFGKYSSVIRVNIRSVSLLIIIAVIDCLPYDIELRPKNDFFFFGKRRAISDISKPNIMGLISSSMFFILHSIFFFF